MTNPSMAHHEQRAYGAYLILRRRYADGLRVLESLAGRPGTAGTVNLAGVMARAYNGLHQHERARAVCLTAVATLAEADFAFAGLNLRVQIELVMAEAGLGHFAEAKALLQKLFALHEPQLSPVTLGSLHEASARVALAERDLTRAREQLGLMEEYYRRTGVATLVEVAARLRRELNRSADPESSEELSAADEIERARRELMRVQLTLKRHDSTRVSERAQKGLQIALKLSSADAGFIVLADSQGAPAAYLGGGSPSTELVLWAEQSMLAAGVDDQTVMTAEFDSDVDSNYKVEGEMRYCLVPLWAHQHNEERVVAALVLGFQNRVPRMPEPGAIRAIAMHLTGPQS